MKHVLTLDGTCDNGNEPPLPDIILENPDDEAKIFPVPRNHPAGCCACPEHNPGRFTAGRLVSAASALDYLRKDANGVFHVIRPGDPVYPGEAVYIAGLSASSVPWNRTGVFDWKDNGVTKTLTNKVNVASTRVVRNINGNEQQSIEARLALAATNGVDTVKANRLFQPFYLFSDVMIDSHLILSMQGGMTARLWSGPTTNSTLLLECNPNGQTITNGVSVVNGQAVNFATHGLITEVWLQVLAPGTGSISYGFVGKGDATGINFTDTLPVKAYRDKLKVQVMAEGNYSTSLETGDAINTNINWGAFNLTNVMNAVADFYADPERGAGIDLEWEITPFDMPNTTLPDGSVTNFFKYTGDIHYEPSDAFPNGGQVITNGKMWVWRDNKLRRDNLDLFWRTFGRTNVNWGVFVQHNRNDTELRDFIKIILPSRIGIRERDGQYRYMTDPRSNAANNITSAILEARGAHVNVVNVSEEKYLATTNHIPSDAFLDLVKFCIAHELFHLIGGTDRPNASGYISGPPPPIPFAEVKASPTDIQEVNLPGRFSILP